MRSGPYNGASRHGPVGDRPLRITVTFETGGTGEPVGDRPVESLVIRVGPARLPSRESPEEAVSLLVEAGYRACELDFETGFWMERDFAEALGESARASDVALSVHAPLAAFPGHTDRGAKLRRATGMLDHSAGLAAACGAELVVVHPGFLLGRITRRRSTPSATTWPSSVRGSRGRAARCPSGSR